MPNIKSAKKRDAKSKAQRLKNRAERTQLRTALKKFDVAVAEGNKDAAVESYKSAVKTVDKASGKVTGKIPLLKGVVITFEGPV